MFMNRGREANERNVKHKTTQIHTHSGDRRLGGIVSRSSSGGVRVPTWVLVSWVTPENSKMRNTLTHKTHFFQETYNKHFTYGIKEKISIMSPILWTGSPANISSLNLLGKLFHREFNWLIDQFLKNKTLNKQAGICFLEVQCVFVCVWEQILPRVRIRTVGWDCRHARHVGGWGEKTDWTIMFEKLRVKISLIFISGS